MRFLLKVLCLTGGLLGFSQVGLSACEGASLGLDAGWERLHSHSKLELQLPAGFGTYSKTTDKEAELQLAQIEVQAPIACKNFDGVSLGLVGVFQLGQANGRIDSLTDDNQQDDVTIGGVASGPKGCLFFSSKTNLCMGLLARAVGIKIGKDFSSTGGTLSPVFAIEQGLGEHVKIRAQAAFAATELRLKDSLQDYNQTDYTLGIGYVWR